MSTKDSGNTSELENSVHTNLRQLETLSIHIYGQSVNKPGTSQRQSGNEA